MQLPEGGKNPKRPVIIHLHPGGFYGATGRSNWAGPQYFLDRDIVLITMNYRIGSLGFISLGKDAPGNNGLRDQVVAMKWVKNNIAAFGGDPDSVTLYGYSSGAWSITLHIVSPMSRGLFHKAILGSGSALGYWPLPKNQIELAKKQARFVGCPDNTPKEILDCLKTKPAEELANSLPQFAEIGYDPILIWSPVIEEDFGQQRFLHDHPIKLIESGHFENIPVVAGITKDEIADRAVALLSNATLLKEYNSNFEKYAPISFLYERGTEKSRQVSRAIRKFYLDDQPLSNASLTGLANVYADAIGFQLDRAVQLLSEKCSKPVYYYEFTYQGRYSHFYLPGTQTPYGVVHHDDLIYSFYISPLFPFFNESYPEAEMVEKLTTIWANFAKTGKPIPKPTQKLDGLEWETYNVHTKKYMDIGKKLSLKDHLFENRYAFWRKLYPISLYL
ncbi:COesterase domain containing protein [Asbolus verrucosus]|uniref:Carboxylic ester hydrolase n=1 Tax=Asbolus verrucosus TaxID=1661398 RepID=A0A482VGN9_ASBVE|nr:COesterase domain containing protein [Asbolus verrucosus]